MDITGSYTFAAPPDRVWALLMDPGAIAACIPGCTGFEPDGPDRYRVRMNVAMAAITGTYDGTVALSHMNQPTSYRLDAEGQGRAGFVNGGADVTLRTEGTSTVIDVRGTVQTGGPIARLGQRLVGSVSKMMLDRFFACLQARLE